MKLAELRADKDYFTGKLSDICRQLSFAGIAIIWIFRVGGNDSGGIPFAASLLTPLALLTVSLALDILHYLYASIAWSIYHRHKERTGTREDVEFKAPPQINWPTNTIFYAKVLATVWGYACLLIYLYERIFAGIPTPPA